MTTDAADAQSASLHQRALLRWRCGVFALAATQSHFGSQVCNSLLSRAMDCQSFAFVRMRIACVPHAAGRFCTIAQDRRGPCAGAESRLGGHSPICPRFAEREGRAVSRLRSRLAWIRAFRDSAATQRGHPKRITHGGNESRMRSKAVAMLTPHSEFRTPHWMVDRR